MKNFLLKASISLVTLCFTSLSIYAQFPLRIGKNYGTRRQLIRQNTQLIKELDSLKQVIEELNSQIAYNDSLRSELIEVFEENEDKVAAGLDSVEYTNDVTDSLLNIWYLHRQNNRTHEGEDYDMDAVKFSSNVPDAVFLDRLTKMNSYITLPYNETVRNYMILYSEKMPTKMSHMLGLASYYMPIFEETLSKYNMPDELKYMAVIESALNPVAVSRAGAKGMWQFMYNSAKLYGLKINSFVDERLDPFKAADAAARYMKDAYNIFGDWNLAISAYNCGSGNVNKAIRRSGKRDFWSIYDYLPRETRGYVPAFVGAMYAFTYFKEHGLTPDKVQMPAHVDTFEIKKMLHFKQINEVAGVPMEVLRQLNPQYIKDIIPGNEDAYILRLPYNYTSSFIENEDSIYNYKVSELFNPTELRTTGTSNEPEPDRIVYKVKSGDYLGRIAARYHVSVSQIKKWNHLRSSSIRKGQRLVIYRGGYSGRKVSPPVSKSEDDAKSSSASNSNSDNAGNQSSSTRSGGYTTYTVKAGDSLFGIAKKYPGVSANDIMKFNNIGTKIRPGMKIKIPNN